jgi:hypothetical protein
MQWFRLSLPAVAGLNLIASEGSGPGAWVVPVIRPYTAVAGGGYEHRPEVALADGGRFELDLVRTSLRTQVWRDGNGEVVLSGSWQEAHLRTDAVFPSVGDFPGRLHDLRLGALYRHVTPAKSVIGAYTSIGTADERPYSSSEGTSLTATAFWRHPLARDAWVFTITYIEDAAILGGIPLPGLTYEWHPDPATTVLIGVPFTFVTWKPDERTSLNASLSVFGTTRVGASTAPWDRIPWLLLQAGFDYGAETAKWPERLPEDERVHVRAAKASAGVGFRAGPLRTGSLTGGWLFAREVGIGDSLFDLEDSIHPDPGPFVALNLVLGF